jgi:oligosaccharide repeat unit polymerase
MAYIPFIYFTVWLVFHLRKSNMRFGAGAMSLLWIDIGSLFEILLDARNLYGNFGCNDYAISAVGVILYCALWTIVLYPLTKLDRKDIQLTINKTQLFHYLCIFFAICGVFYILVSGSYTKIIENLQGSRLDAYDKSNDNSTIYQSQHQFWLWIPNLVINMWPLLLLCWFISLNLCKQPAWIRWGLLFLSAYMALVGFSGGGRAQILWWAITFLVYYFLFRPQLELRQRRLISCIFGAFGVVGVLGFMAITISRFDSNVSGYVFDALVGYAGQPLNNFCAILPYVDVAHLFTDRLLPLITFLQTHQPYNLHEYYEFLGIYYPLQMNVFFTCFGQILIDAGLIGLIFLLLIYIFVAHFLRLSSQKIDFCQLIILVLLFYFPIRGFFGWPFLGQINETLGIFMSIGLYILFKYTFKIKR